MAKQFYLILLLILGTVFQVQGMIFDNRFFPLYLKPLQRKPCYRYYSRIQPFFTRAEKGQGNFEEGNIPDIDGEYHLLNISNSLENIGLLSENPFRSDLKVSGSLPFSRIGKIDSQGIAFLFEMPITCNVSLGIDFLFMHISSRHEFLIPSKNDTLYLFTMKDRLNKLLGVCPSLYSQTVFGDTDLYLRYNWYFDHICKFRSVIAGLKLGTYIPTATKIPINNPAAIEAGGRGHWGLYVDLESQYEVREDMFATVLFRAIKRFKKTSLSRMPVFVKPFEAPPGEKPVVEPIVWGLTNYVEPEKKKKKKNSESDEKPKIILPVAPLKYGAITGDLEVDPGWSFVFNPSFRIESLREGLGVSVMYTLVAHLEDSFEDKRRNKYIGNKKIRTYLDLAIENSSWAMETVTFGLFYDFTKYQECPRFSPILSAYWDMPVDWLVAKRSAKSNAVSVMFELSF